jgi:hypothetical protein
VLGTEAMTTQSARGVGGGDNGHLMATATRAHESVAVCRAVRRGLGIVVAEQRCCQPRRGTPGRNQLSIFTGERVHSMALEVLVMEKDV